ncbi:MAG TPA: protein phosphatase 2C domain-containing protein [Caldimonas sp.]|jgi:serine/threonine protein phosphatase PrpC|nr:protein phosphatase 2C domain-containing protein [Caldimonas sp.]HEX2540052.1 protein phosphatase 2C domain-containing protein [Caldimonas sp.]
MATPLSPVRLTTPIEPGPPAAHAHRAPRSDHCVYADAFRRFEVAVVSSCGTQHAANEDAHSALGGPGSLFVVADGVGGGAMAQTASRLLVAQLHDALEAEPIDADSVRAAMLDADRAIAGTIARSTDRPGAATVALCAPLDVFAARWLVGWVGDCRVYRARLRAGPALDLLTRDDTFGNLGEAPPPGGSPDDPARMVGNGAVAAANVALHDLGRGDVLAVCSDGVHKFVDATEWCRVLEQPVPLARVCDKLVATARRNGSKDDATVLLLRRAPAALPGLRWTARSIGPGGPGRRQP